MFLIINKVKLDISLDLHFGEINTILSDFLTHLLSRTNIALSAFNWAISYQWIMKHSSERNIPEVSAVCSILSRAGDARIWHGPWLSVPRAGMITGGGLHQLYPAWHGLVTHSGPVSSHNYSQDWAAKYMFTPHLHSDKNPTIS